MGIKLKIQEDHPRLKVGEDGDIQLNAQREVRPILVNDYDELINKPSINGVELSGDKTTEDLGIQAGVTSWNGETGDVVYTPPVTSVNGQTGAVDLDAQAVGALPDDTPIPTKVSDLNNDSNFVNAAEAAAAAPVQSVNGQTGTVTIEEVPDGGATGQVLTKKSNTDGDTEWKTPAAVPTKVSQLQNDSAFVNAAEAAAAAPVQSVNGQTGAVTVAVPTKTSQLSNDSGFITGINSTDVTDALGFTPYDATNPSGYVDNAGAAAAAPVQSVNGATGSVSLGAADVSALPDDTKYALSPEVGGSATFANGIHYAAVKSTSTSTAFKADIPAIKEYYDGLTIMLFNGVVTSAANFTIEINNLGALGSYSNMALGNRVTPTNPTRDTTIFNINYAMIFTYCSHIGGSDTAGWIGYRGYDANTNTLAYQVRTNNTVRKVTDRTRYYRVLFSSADDTKWVPANTQYDNSATSSKTVNQRPINPFGEIVYLGNSTNYAADANMTATAIWQQYQFTLGYSFNRTGAALTLTSQKPVYVKCAPQADGSAIIDSTEPIVQALPTTDDGKIYIFLGVAYSATQIEMTIRHPVYYYKNGAIRLWTNLPIYNGGVS